MKQAALVAAAIIIGAAMISAAVLWVDDDDAGEAAPDVVVGIQYRCESFLRDFPERFTERERCEREIAGLLNHRLALTIRTADGFAYEVEVDPDTDVAIGDSWPPATTSPD